MDLLGSGAAVPINGKTRLLGVLGWPVEHTRSPVMHNAALLRAEINAVYLPLPVRPEHLPAALAGMRAMQFIGGSVTIPHKEATAPLMDHLTDIAAAIGAVNTVRVEPDGRLTGHNTDGEGAVRALAEDGTDVRGRHVVIAGAGGAARGTAAGCALAGAGAITILNRTPARAEKLVQELSSSSALPRSIRWEAGGLDHPVDWPEVAAFLQMSSAGMDGDRTVPVDTAILPPQCHVLEAVYSPLETPLLEQARARGLRVTDGLAMLLEQGAAAFEFWLGRTPDRRVMREALTAAPGKADRSAGQQAKR